MLDVCAFVWFDLADAYFCYGSTITKLCLFSNTPSGSKLASNFVLPGTRFTVAFMEKASSSIVT